MGFALLFASATGGRARPRLEGLAHRLVI